MAILKDISNINQLLEMIQILEQKKKEAIKRVNDDFCKILDKYVENKKAVKLSDYKTYSFNEGVTVWVVNGQVNMETTRMENGVTKYPLYSCIKEKDGKLVLLSRNYSGKGQPLDPDKFGPDINSFIKDCCKSK